MEKSGDKCECILCNCHKGLYLTMKSSVKCKWLTISPSYSDEEPKEYIQKWMMLLGYFYTYVAKDYIQVYELSDQGRIHLHIVYTVNDRIKEYLFLNRLRCGMLKNKESIKRFGKDFCRPCMVRVYDGTPKEGLHYLFKDVVKLQQMGFGINDVVTSSQIHFLV